MKFTTEINATVSYLIKSEGYKRSEATRLAMKIHAPNVKQVRQRLQFNEAFVLIFDKANGERTSRNAISIANAIERGLFQPTELSAEQKETQAKRRDNRFPQGYVKFFDMAAGEPRMAFADKIVGCEEI
jgi:predicted AAA+ superfamily ATPase